MLNFKHISVSIRYLNDKSRNADSKDGVKIMKTGVVEDQQRSILTIFMILGWMTYLSM